VKLGLGTVQFGLDYGVTNRQGRVPVGEVERIIEQAAAAGVRIIDTAAVYGMSESILGSVLPNTHAFDLITKTPQFNVAEITGLHAEQLHDAFRQSLEHLRQPHVYGLMLHRVADLFTPGGVQLWDAMVSLRQAGLVQKIGASVYSGEEIDRLLEYEGVDLVQLPLSWLDQRLAKSGHLARLHAAGVEVHVRSAFLQGILLQRPEDLPAFFTPLCPHLQACHERFANTGLSAVAAALAYPSSHPEVAAVVCGVTSLNEWRALVAGAAARVPSFDWQACALEEPAWLNPALWRIQPDT